MDSLIQDFQEETVCSLSLLRGVSRLIWKTQRLQATASVCGVYDALYTVVGIQI